MSHLKIREWRELHGQLVVACRQMNMRVKTPRSGDDAYDAIHQALLSGFVANIAQQDEGRRFNAGRNRKAEHLPRLFAGKETTEMAGGIGVGRARHRYLHANAERSNRNGCSVPTPSFQATSLRACLADEKRQVDGQRTRHPHGTDDSDGKASILRRGCYGTNDFIRDVVWSLTIDPDISSSAIYR